MQPGQRFLKNRHGSIAKFRLLICGPGRAGKTSFYRSLFGLPFSRRVDSTIGVKMEKATCTATREGGRLLWKPIADEERQLMQMMAQSLTGATREKKLIMKKQEETEEPEPRQETTREQEAEGLLSHELTDPQSPGEPSAEFLPEEASRAHTDATIGAAEKKANGFVGDFYERRASVKHQDGTSMAFIDVLDFAGQEAFSVVQHMLISKERCGNAVVFDVSKPLDAVADLSICIDGVDHPIVNTTGKTNFDIIEEWLAVLYEAGGADSPIYLIACKIDRVSLWKSDRNAVKSKVEAFLWKNLSGKPYASAVERIYFVDNSRSGSLLFSADENVTAFRGRFFSDMMKSPSLSSSIPLRWVPFTVALQSLAEQQRPVLALSEAVTLATSSGACETEAEALPMLEFHHQLGNLMYFPRSEALCRRVIVDIHWIIRLVSALLVPCHDIGLQHKRYRSHYSLLYERGILVESLAMHMWEQHCPELVESLKDDGFRQFVFSLIEEFALVFSTKQMMVVDEDEPNRKYLMPSLVQAVSKLELSSTSSADGVSPPICIRVGKKKLLPSTIFWRLGVCLLLHFREKMPEVSRATMPTLHRNAIRLLVDHSYWLEVLQFSTGLVLVVQRDSSAAVLGAEAHQPKSMKETCSTVLPLVETKLRSLESMGSHRLEWSTTCVCPCAQSATCRKHSSPGCRRLECQHFIQLVEGLAPRCPRGNQLTQDVSSVVSTWMPHLKVSVPASQDSFGRA